MSNRTFIFLIVGFLAYTASMITAAHYFGEKKFVQGWLSGSQANTFDEPVKSYINDRVEFCSDAHGNLFRAEKKGRIFRISKY